MAIVVLVLWAFTAGAGFYLLVTSNPGRQPRARPPRRVARPARRRSARRRPPPRPPSRCPAEPPAAPPPAEPVLAQPVLAERVPAAAASPAGPATGASRTAPSRRDARDPWAPPSLVAARQAPLVPGARALAEFAHPAAGIVGLGFWLGFTLVHARVLGWIGFGLAAATACMGLAWFAANTRAARRPASPASQRRPSPAASSRCTAARPPSPSPWPR